ncbi:SRPBCC family protein [Plantibacter sp. YIM 135249]|uniref:SRPBCC family protein n=1 Tax=Plantibacter sp. YIM 135249 TaxID=3423918 RepID=UPI003D32795F
MTVHFTCRTELPVAPERAFELSRSIDAHLGSMADTREQAVGGVTSGLIGDGEEVTWRARHFGVTWSMTSRITAFDAPRSFTDEQVRGPFRSFRHVHTFVPVPEPVEGHFDEFSDRDGGRFDRLSDRKRGRFDELSDRAECTLMIDDVTFTAPFGPIGRLAERIALASHLRRLIESRNAWLSDHVRR